MHWIPCVPREAHGDIALEPELCFIYIICVVHTVDIAVCDVDRIVVSAPHCFPGALRDGFLLACRKKPIFAIPTLYCVFTLPSCVAVDDSIRTP